MPPQFSSLPFELRYQIYDLALHRSPRNVEVEVRDSRVVSKTPPPALLHLNRESRNFVLSVYKPWLPQFAGTLAHRPYAVLLAKYRPSETHPVSCLDDVCFDLERDTLFCKSVFASRYKASGWPVFLFGRIEESCLRNMTINIEGYLSFPRVVEALKRAKSLKALYLLDFNTDAAGFKSIRISEGLRRCERKDKVEPKVRGPNYVAPRVKMAPTSYFIPKSGPIPLQQPSCRRVSGREIPDSNQTSDFDSSTTARMWTTYKFSPRSSGISTRPSEHTQIKQTFHPRKRKADMASGNNAPMVAEWAKRIKPRIRTQEQNEVTARSFRAPPAQPLHSEPTHIWTRQDDLAQMSEETKRQHGIVERATSPSAASSNSSVASEASSSSVQSQASSSRPASEAGSVGDEDDNSEASDSESDDDAEDEAAASQERTPRQLHAHRFNFDIGAPEVLVEWEDSPEMATWQWVPKADLLPTIPIMIAAFVANNSALEAGTPIKFHERNSGVVGFDFLVEFEGFPEETYWTWVPESNMQARVPHMVDQWMTDNASVVNADANADEQILAEQNHAENGRGKDEEKDEFKEEDELEEEEIVEEEKEEEVVADTADADMKDDDYKDKKVDEIDEDGGDGEASEYVPKRFVAQRETPDGPEILVEWEDWPDEKDFTWEPVSNLQEDAPEMMKAWKASRKPKKVLKVYEVESILGKRKIKGEWHYLVKWKGFSKDEAKSLEPCEKIAVDIPELVEAFNNRKPKRGRPKKTASA